MDTMTLPPRQTTAREVADAASAGLIPLKELARQVTVDAGVWGQIPVPVERIADSLRLVPMAFDPAKDPDLKDYAGAIDHANRVVYVNKADPPVRRRFTMAHEIGHAVLHPGEDILDFRRNIDGPRDPKEIEANKFAAELLMPEDEFRRAWAVRRADKQRLAVYFGVSVQAATYRADNLGLPSNS